LGSSNRNTIALFIVSCTADGPATTRQTSGATRQHPSKLCTPWAAAFFVYQLRLQYQQAILNERCRGSVAAIATNQGAQDGCCCCFLPPTCTSTVPTAAQVGFVLGRSRYLFP
jgi:hypothetical protein